VTNGTRRGAPEVAASSAVSTSMKAVAVRRTKSRMLFSRSSPVSGTSCFHVVRGDEWRRPRSVNRNGWRFRRGSIVGRPLPLRRQGGRKRLDQELQASPAFTGPARSSRPEGESSLRTPTQVARPSPPPGSRYSFNRAPVPKRPWAYVKRLHTAVFLDRGTGTQHLPKGRGLVP